MNVHNNIKFNLIISKRWKCDCKYYGRKPSGCKAGHTKCNPDKCLKYEEKSPKNVVK